MLEKKHGEKKKKEMRAAKPVSSGEVTLTGSQPGSSGMEKERSAGTERNALTNATLIKQEKKSMSVFSFFFATTPSATICA